MSPVCNACWHPLVYGYMPLISACIFSLCLLHISAALVCKFPWPLSTKGTWGTLQSPF